jgi:hypothetical protein
MQDQPKAEASPKKRQTGRSPSYPSFAIDKALEQVAKLAAKEGSYAVPLKSAMNAWGYSDKSSGGRQSLATIKYFGLIDITGEGDDRKVKVSDLARRILGDKREDETEKKRLIREAAMTPAAHQALFAQYPSGLASDGTVHHFLVFEKGFSDDAAVDLIAEFKRTAAYVGLYEPQKVVDIQDDQCDDSGTGNGTPAVSVGSKIQWTSAGVDMLAVPATVLSVSPDGNWVFTDAGDTWIPLKEVTIVNAAQILDAPPPIPPELLAARDAMKRGSASSALKEGQTVLSRGQLKSGSFEVLVTGIVGAKEIGKIIKILEAQKLVLTDDEEDGDD